ncbi:long-chain acyl-CoA synthetase [Nocardia amikacinitolerans]|uniref:class I adenylate-forming enzyme family protein n=1 Tax=Nocardia amikacinitolerans TaxID=756689 RepID=UPI000AF66F27|nr:class I adenylate-forming enzyme family protein [Nocardia amikacinitolerans]MCP2300070.1 long-chain acyl-CoA synthetase [Nocardia amikacinitolerans]MCP2320208.1 long-chain acyl-CoA synthetase [Nocardia amikacinitolerans]
MTTLMRELDQRAEENPSVIACRIGNRSQTFGELAQQVRLFAAALLELGLEPGDRVSLYLPNSVEYVTCWYGAMRAGMVANPINAALSPREVEFLLDDSGAQVLVTTANLAGKLGEILSERTELRLIVADADISASGLTLADLLTGGERDVPYPPGDAAACLPYSSGTTGRPKGVVHSHDSLSAQAVLSANALQLRTGDILVHALPLVHLFAGNIVMGGLLVAGATMVVQPSFDPSGFVDLLAETRATACAGVPANYAMLTRLPDDNVRLGPTDALQVAFSAGAPLPTAIREGFRARFGAPVLNCYGITEAGGNLAASLRYGETPDLSCGIVYPRTELRIVDSDDNPVPAGEVGELVARGPQIMTGYWRRPSATAQALRGGWFHTGDLARFDADGYLYIVDRRNDLIVSGGYNVYPAEVEDVLQEHPGVESCAVFGIEDSVKGEKPWAAVVPANAAVDVESLESFCRERLAAYKVPRRFVVVDEIPRNSLGKLQRGVLRKRYSPESSSSTSTS